MPVSRDAGKGQADSLAAYLQISWGLPLGAARSAPPLPRTILPSEVVRLALSSGDLRLVRALPLWLSLIPKVDPPPPWWPVDDRRRLAYLCEISRALASLRRDRGHVRGDSWPASAAGIQPGRWRERVPLCESPGPAAAPSMFGERWGIEEPMTFPEYVAFQDQFLSLKRRKQGDGARAGTDRRGPEEADPPLR